jgi:hypothetical protein
VTSQAGHASEDLLVALVLGFDLDPISPVDGNRQLECVDRVEAEPLAEQRRLCVDVFRTHILEHQGLDDELL